MDLKLNEDYWTSKYTTKSTGWDIGEVSSPLKTYFDKLQNRKMKILIPGAGNAYEAEYLHLLGFENVYVLDMANPPLKNLKMRCPDFPEHHMIKQDIFELDGQFDLIIEQTFFCALNPSMRELYAIKMHELLAPRGKLVGLLFNIPLNLEHPPFGGNKEEYLTYFDPLFQIEVFELCYNSIAPRQGSELFIKLSKGV